MSRNNGSRRWPLITAAVLLVLLGSPLVYLWAKGPAFGEKLLVKVVPVEGPAVSEQTKAFHRELFIADMHADPLLWARDLSQHARRGHVDVPRLLEGNVGLQVQ